MSALPVTTALVADRAVRCHTIGLARQDWTRVTVASLTGTSIGGEVVDGTGEVMCRVGGDPAACHLTGPAPYRLLLRGSVLDDSGYRVSARRMNSPIGCTAIDSIAVGISDRRGQLPETDSVACFRFDGAAADQLELRASNPDFPADTRVVHLIAPDGSTVCTAYGTTSCTLPQSGAYAVLVQGATPGAFVLGATCLNPACGSDVFTVSSTSPRSAGKAGSVTITIQGKALTLDSDVTLVRSGVRIAGVPQSVTPDARWMDVRFDLSAAALGAYSVEVASPGDGTITVPSAFTLEAPRVQDVRATLVGLGRFVAGRKQTISVVVENFGNIDAVGVPLVVEGFPVGTEITPKFPMTNTTGADTPILTQEWRPQNSVYTRGGVVGLPLLISNVPGGKKHQYDFEINVPVAADYDIKLLVGGCIVDTSAGGSPTAARAVGGPQKFLGIGGACGDLAVSAATNFIPGGPCVGMAADSINAVSNNLVTGAPPFSASSSGEAFLAATSQLACVASVIPGGQIAAGILGGLSTLGSLATGAKGCYDQLSNPQNSVASLDPNELVGPSGGGGQHAIRGGGTHTFAVYFENDKTASAPAQEVRVVDTLDPAQYDLSTVRFGGVRFGNTLWTPPSGSTTLDDLVDIAGTGDLQVDVKASVVGGQVRWHLMTVDPLTGQLPEDPFRGFLPPNVDGSEGQGVLYFDVRPKSVPEGTLLSSRASIVFDLNPAILTNTWTNLIDGTAPTAGVKAPASTGTASFPVSWTAADTHSGIASVDVFVAVDGGTYALWKASSGAGSANYPGAAGHTYRFSAVAHDRAGNVSLLPPTPHAATVVKLKPSLSAKASSPARRTAVVKVTVKAGGALVKGAKITVKEGRKVRKKVTLRSGRGSIRLTKVPRGKHRYTVVLSATSKVLGTSKKLAALKVR